MFGAASPASRAREWTWPPVVGLIAAGETVETVASEYQLTIEQVRAALAYAAHVAAHPPPAVRHAS